MHFRSNGKLLITGEYLVLDGAKALALPTQKGQSIRIEKTTNRKISWTSWSTTEEVWFSCTFSLDLEIMQSSDAEKAVFLKKILQTALHLSNTSNVFDAGAAITTILEFPTNWGLGSSSTLINNIAYWFEIDPYALHFAVSNGSGYDIACAASKGGILYQLKEQHPIVVDVVFNPSFKGQIHFIHLNKKQISNNEVDRYNLSKENMDLNPIIDEISKLTNQILQTSTIEEFNAILFQHESILSHVLQRETLQESTFPMYKTGVVKSLGAWGGDFALVTGPKKNLHYFLEKGYSTIIPFDEMVQN